MLFRSSKPLRILLLDLILRPAIPLELLVLRLRHPQLLIQVVLICRGALLLLRHALHLLLLRDQLLPLRLLRSQHLLMLLFRLLVSQ